MKERLIVFVRSIEMMKQVQQRWPIKSSELGLTSFQVGCDFESRLAIGSFDVVGMCDLSTGPTQKQ
jgi:hypothetical protein